MWMPGENPGRPEGKKLRAARRKCLMENARRERRKDRSAEHAIDISHWTLCGESGGPGIAKRVGK